YARRRTYLKSHKRSMKKPEIIGSLPERGVEGREACYLVQSLPLLGRTWYRKAMLLSRPSAHCSRRESMSAALIGDSQNMLEPLTQPNRNGHNVLEWSAQLIREGHKALEQSAQLTREGHKALE